MGPKTTLSMFHYPEATDVVDPAVKSPSSILQLLYGAKCPSQCLGTCFDVVGLSGGCCSSH